MTIQDAMNFAVKAHAGVKRKYTGADYSTHPFRVCEMARQEGLSKPAIMAAALHDVEEDAPAFVPEMEEKFGTEVAGLVHWLTNPSKGSPELPRARRKEMDRNHLRVAPLEVRVVKAMDRLDNLLEMGGADQSFRAKYSKESLLLADALVELGSSEVLDRYVRRLREAAEALPRRKLHGEAGIVNP